MDDCSHDTSKCTDDLIGTLVSAAMHALSETQKPINVDRCDANYLKSFNCTEQEYLVYERGERVSNLWFTISITVSYTLILLAGFIGNATVCVIIACNRSMHTATNYYLFNLAIADTLYLLFGLPFEIHMFWHNYPWLFGATFCKLKSLISEACSYASVLTIVAFSVERYIAICHPIYAYVMDNLKRVILVIVLIWVVSFVSALPFALYRYVNYIIYPPPNGEQMIESAICAMHSNFKGLYEASTIMFFIIPLFVLIILYARIATKLQNREECHSQGKFGKYTNPAAVKQMKSKSIIRMLITLVITFFVSWAPFHAQRLVFLYGQHWNNYHHINEILFTTAGVFYYLSCTMNPIIYNVMSHRYREAFYKTFCLKLSRTPTTSSTNTS